MRIGVSHLAYYVNCYRIVICALSRRYVLRLDFALVGYARGNRTRGDPVGGALDASPAALWETGQSRQSSRARRPARRGAAGMNLGYPWWLLAAVLVAFALLSYYLLRDRVSGWPLAGLSAALAPVCALAAVAAALTLSAVLSPLLEPLAGPSVEPELPAQEEPATTDEQTEPTTFETTGPGTASPTASPSASPSTSPSPSATATSSASASP